MDRRDFLKTVPVFAGALAGSKLASGSPAPTVPGATRLETFEYHGVRLLDSRWRDQMEAARAFYLAIPDEDILQGFRAAAGRPAPGRALGGWCAHDSSTVFGQWLSGISRLYRATGDAALRDKAVGLFTEWTKTIGADGDCRMRHYPYDKLVCGLVDLERYAGHHEAIGALEKVTDFASRTFDRSNHVANPAENEGYYGRPQEWYTLSENLYRAFELTGNPRFKAFGDAWLYHEYWDKFASTSQPADAHGVHAYSHVNTFSSAAMAYAVTGDAAYLRIIRNAYDYLQRTQCFATGGYGPNERFMAPDGSLGRSLDTRSDTCEIVCGSWAGFKLSRYLMRFTGEARYGDWIERLLYNGVGAALPLAPGGRNFYYADYRVGGGMKVYNWDTFTCCSGTYIQNVAEYHNLIYFKDASSLYVNLYLPSEATWTRAAGDVRITLDTRYPDEDTVTLTVRPGASPSFALNVRVPAWSKDMSIAVNGVPSSVPCTPGTWATLARTWHESDQVTVRIPLALRMEPVDRQHPDRVAVVRGPAMLALEGPYHDPYFRLPDRDDDLPRWLVPEDWRQPTAILTPPPESTRARTVLRVVPPDNTPVRLKFRPFYDIGPDYPYFTYFDRKSLPYRLW